MIRILVVDDQKVIREGLKLTLAVQPDFEIVGLAENGQVGVELVDALRPDLVLLDMEMPIMDGVEATRKIRQRFPETKVLVLTTSSQEAHVVAGLDAGAHGYLLKETPEDDLINAIHAVHKGYAQLSPGLLANVTTQALTTQAQDPTSTAPQWGLGRFSEPHPQTRLDAKSTAADVADGDRLYTDEFIRENEDASRMLLFSVVCAAMLTMGIAMASFLFQQGEQAEPGPEPLIVPEAPPLDPQITTPSPQPQTGQTQPTTPVNPTLPLPPPLPDTTATPPTDIPTLPSSPAPTSPRPPTSAPPTP